MNNLGKFLWKMFCATMVFFLNTRYNNAIAEGTIADPKLTKYFIDSDTAQGKPQTMTICGAGYYVKACGDTILGTNWLHGMTKTKGLEAQQQIQTPDYSSKNGDDDWPNFRSFFAGKSFEYQNQEGTPITVNAQTVQEYRNQILSNFCTNTTGELVWASHEESGIVCFRCPNYANVQPSTVDKDYDTGKLLQDSWKIHTIADCYMNEFSDETGTYIYLDYTHLGNQVALSANRGDNCYYSKSVKGTKLYYR